MQPGSIALNGEVGFDRLTPLLEQARALGEHPQDVQVNWAEAQWIHFACLQLLLALERTLEQSGHHITFSEPSSRVAQSLREFNMASLFGVN